MLEKLISSRWLHVILLLMFLSASVFFSFSHSRWREQIRNFTFDNYNIANPRVASDSVVIVDIDEASLRLIGQMPWPRTVMADLVTKLKNMGASVVAFDIVFPEPDRNSPGNMAQLFSKIPGNQDVVEHLRSMPDNDEIFGQAIASAGNVITGFSFTNEQTASIPVQKGIFRGRMIENFIPRLAGATANQKAIEKNAAGNGSFFVSTDTDGIIRRVPMLIAHSRPESDITSVYPSLTLEVMRVLEHERGGRVLLANPEYAKLDPARFGITGVEIGQGRKVIPTNARGEFLVYFAKSDKAWYVPAWQILDQSFAPEKIKGKIVLIGTSAVGLKDIRSTPLDTFIPGVEVHLNIIDQILQGKFLTRSIEAEGAEAVVIIAVGLFIILFAPFIGALSQALFVIIIILTGIHAGLYAFREYGLLIDVTYPAFSVLAIFMVSTVLTYLRSERERRQVRQAFGLYISPAFIEELARDPEKLKLGGDIRELSVMFTDIRRFTTISEGLSPQELIQLMNDFLTPMSDLVMENRGTIDKYIGDAMMAFWNAPLDDTDHARHACRTALKMQEALSPVNEGIQARAGKDAPVLQVGIGINSGLCAVGNMGSRQRFAYSALGDAVNLASRLEGQTKYYGVPIIIGQATRERAPDFAALEIDLVRVQGKENVVRIYALCGDEAAAQTQPFKAMQKKHDEMMALYRQGDFPAVKKLSEQVPDAFLRKLYEVYAGRVQAFIKNPPENWDGVFEAKSK